MGPLLGVFEPIVRDDDGRIRYHYVVIDYLAVYMSAATSQSATTRPNCAGSRSMTSDAYPLLPATREMIERARGSRPVRDLARDRGTRQTRVAS